jgi:hypothetical protein
MNIDIKKTRLCKTFFSLWFAVFIIFLGFGGVTSVLGINFEASDKPIKTVPICGTPVTEKQFNQPQVRCFIRE